MVQANLAAQRDWFDEIGRQPRFARDRILRLNRLQTLFREKNDERPFADRKRGEAALQASEEETRHGRDAAEAALRNLQDTQNSLTEAEKLAALGIAVPEPGSCGHAVLGLEMADDGLDGGPAAQLARDLRRYPSLLAGGP
jgi:hypothetical protein